MIELVNKLVLTLDSVSMIDELSLDNVFSDEARSESSSSWSFLGYYTRNDGVVDDLGGGCISFENEEVMMMMMMMNSICGVYSLSQLLKC